MSAMAGAGLVGALAVVIAILLLGAHAAQRLGLARAVEDRRFRVLSRLSLGPRQGIVVVRIGSRCLALTHGEGGIRALLELDERDAAAFEPAPPAGEFARLLRTGLRRTAGVIGAVLALGATAAAVTAQTTANAAPAVQLALGSGGTGGLEVSGAVGTVLVLGALTMLPAVLLLMTGFTRILIVLHLLRQALGTQTAPPGQLLTALALILTGFVMAPTLARVNETALTPWLDGRMDEVTMMRTAIAPLRDFMLDHTSDADIDNFLELSTTDAAKAPGAEVPTTVLVAAFATSELRAAFKMGFALFLPFVIIDLVVAAVLSGMGMFMLPPTMIALPCKLLLFVLADGWTLTVQALVRSFA